MDDETLLRYSRQILLSEIDIDGQQRLLDGSAAIFGLGGLGSPVALYLAAAGVGRLVLVDFDEVELSNLQRQIIHLTRDLGRPKVVSAAEKIRDLNPGVRVETVTGVLEEEALDAVIDTVDVVIDCTDNFPTRFGLNAACYRRRKPLVSGAAIRFEGQITVFHPGVGESPCYRCLYDDGEGVAETCTQTGVVAPLLGVIGSLQAIEAMKVLMNIGETLQGRLLLLDALSMEWRRLRFRRDPRCPVCGTALDAHADSDYNLPP